MMPAIEIDEIGFRDDRHGDTLAGPRNEEAFADQVAEGLPDRRGARVEPVAGDRDVDALAWMPRTRHDEASERGVGPVELRGRVHRIPPAPARSAA